MRHPFPEKLSKTLPISFLGSEILGQSWPIRVCRSLGYPRDYQNLSISAASLMPCVLYLFQQWIRWRGHRKNGGTIRSMLNSRWTFPVSTKIYSYLQHYWFSSFYFHSTSKETTGVLILLSATVYIGLFQMIPSTTNTQNGSLHSDRAFGLFQQIKAPCSTIEQLSPYTLSAEYQQ